MSAAEDAGAPPWGIPATLAIAVLAFGLGQAVAAVGLSAWLGPAALAGPALPTDGTAVVLVVLAANLIQTVTLVLAARVRGGAAVAYLGLDVPGRRDVLVGVASLVALVVVADIATVAAGRDLVPPVQIATWRSAAAQGVLPLLWFALVIVAPIGEELLFRGFVFRGCARSDTGAMPTIVLTAFVFALLHVQYDWVGILLIFAVGLLLGWLRWRTGSTTLVILLHVLLNLEGTIETMLMAG
ncbi:CPBP family intramembrane metalloprotease [Rhodoplanes sp. TEM]|uniref:CPBP family intramembrane metalloprotease n=1 Tax=Rhodoplanes tepidamans TaxID=200616 RepID=A0ABT5J9V4_RHOTP|nr:MULTISPECIES: CPBP family intramembrane glutamic endopeptidase [Rhodoplanes]MDC7786451.1 CPBP family intramembrane metalloprotease [Rhodoplanes tepidamans]MDC7985093.1 CPBP family intramembrane metalloprotease [Rhodoplanes sp. TEM]MDQ0357336.1 membrane protease YdiL (CAAX protease family) [Rhodoplanes tepidamans]